MRADFFAEEIRYGIIFGTALAVMIMTITGYAIWKMTKQKLVMIRDVIGITIAYFIYLYALLRILQCLTQVFLTIMG